VSGHKIHATDEDKIGSVDDFILDDETWTIRYLVINTGNVFTGKKVLISPEWIDHISWDDSRVYINLTKEALKESPEYTDENGLTRDYESSLFGFYKKTPYWSPEPVSHDYSHSRVNTEGKYSGY
jgi:sporulation protein YlmC with PRC-barrel domain